MNEKKIRTLIEFYINNEQGIHCKGTEGYKWDIFSSIRSEINAYVTKHCRNGEWDQDYSDFHEFTRKTIGKTGNLVYSSSRSVMQKAADKNPEYIRKMFIDLSGFYSDQPLEERVQLFISAIDQIAKDNPDISKSGKSFHRDYRAVSVYLLMMDPKNNYNYMYSTFSDYARFAELDIPKAGDERLLLSYYNACNTIRQILQNDYKQWFESYLEDQKADDESNEGRTDIYGHLLVQDIIFSLYYYHHPEVLPKADEIVVYPTEFNKKPKRKAITPRNGVFIDYEMQQKTNTSVGAAAERFVYENERKLVSGYGFDVSRVRHVSKEIGDGLGYDILSCDEKGNDIYIEVKGTKAGIGTPFFITETELQCSILHSDKYRLYRVYDFSTAGTSGNGKIAVIKGSLDSYCLNPVSYKVIF